MKVTKLLYQSFLLLDRFRFCETHFTTYLRFVADQSAISPFLGGLLNGLDASRFHSLDEPLSLPAMSCCPHSLELCLTSLTIHLVSQVDRKKPPPRGGFLFTMFPHQEP